MSSIPYVVVVFAWHHEPIKLPLDQMHLNLCSLG